MYFKKGPGVDTKESQKDSGIVVNDSAVRFEDTTDITKMTRVGGLRAVEVQYRGIREFESGETTFLQSKTRLNTPDLGTMVPETYRKVAELSEQCITLFEFEMMQVTEAIKSLQERDYYFRWISVYMPLRFLEKKGAQQRLMNMMDETGTDTNRICFELAPAILLEGNSRHSMMIEQLRNRGFHFMLTDFGGINTPLMRLAYFPVDYVMMSQEVNGYLGKGERSLSAVGSVVDFIDGMGAAAIADGVTNVEQAEQLFQAECKYGAGTLAGNYVAARYLRNKKSRDESADE